MNGRVLDTLAEIIAEYDQVDVSVKSAVVQSVNTSAKTVSLKVSGSTRERIATYVNNMPIVGTTVICIVEDEDTIVLGSRGEGKRSEIFCTVEEQSSWVPDTTNDAAYQTALDAAFNNGGGNVLLPKDLRLILPAQEIKNGVNLKGQGAGQTVTGGSKISLYHADSGVLFGNIVTASGGGISEGFHIDGRNVANFPFRVIYTVARTFMGIDINNAITYCQSIEAAQNCKFIIVNSQGSAYIVVNVDKGTGSCSFDKCEYGNGASAMLLIQASTPTASLPGGIQAAPLNNAWRDETIFEYTKPTTYTMIQVNAGTDNIVSDSTISTGPDTSNKNLLSLQPTGEATSLTFKLKGGTAQFNTTHADNTVLSIIGAANFFQEGKTAIVGASTITRLDGTTGSALWDRPIHDSGVVWAVLTGSAPYYNIRSAVDLADPIAMAAAGSPTERIAYFKRDGSVKYLYLYDS